MGRLAAARLAGPHTCARQDRHVRWPDHRRRRLRSVPQTSRAECRDSCLIPVLFCLNYVPMLPLADNMAWWQACERAGIERIGFGDTPALARELYVTLAACAM